MDLGGLRALRKRRQRRQRMTGVSPRCSYLRSRSGRGVPLSYASAVGPPGLVHAVAGRRPGPSGRRAGQARQSICDTRTRKRLKQSRQFSILLTLSPPPAVTRSRSSRGDRGVSTTLPVGANATAERSSFAPAPLRKLPREESQAAKPEAALRPFMRGCRVARKAAARAELGPAPARAVVPLATLISCAETQSPVQSTPR